MIKVARLLRGMLPALAALAAATASALPAQAQASGAAQAAAAAGRGAPPAVTSAGEWWLPALHVPTAWLDAPGRGRGVTVAVLSTGVDAGHPDLEGTVTAGPDFSRTGRKPGSQYWGAEGTAVASLIAGHGHGPGRGDGITGVAPGARILSVQVNLEYNDPLNSDAAITRRLPAAIAAGIRYAVDQGAAVIALPLDPGTFGPASSDPAAAGGSAAERAAIGYARARNVALVAPAGDNGASTGSVNYPAAYPGVIAVGATTRSGQLSPFTSTRPIVALTAPGSGRTPVSAAGAAAGEADPAAGLPVAAPGGGYQSLASTDMAAALTAGVAALIRARYPSLTAAEVGQALEKGAAPPPARAGTGTGSAPAARAAGSAPAGQAASGDAGWGHGALDAAAALRSAAAIAAAKPGAARPSPARPSPARRAPAAGTARPAAASGRDPGAAIRSLLVYLVIAVFVMIAALAAAMALGLLRRRSSARSARAERPGPRDSQPRHLRHPRHARSRSAQPPADARAWAAAPPRTASWPGAPDRAAAVAGWDGRAGQGGPGGTGGQGGTAQPASAALVSPDRSYRRRRLAWQPPRALAAGAADAVPPRPLTPRALPPSRSLQPPRALPAPRALPPAGQADALLPPWELSPDDFAAAPPAQSGPPWPVSSTGPMYVWNPSAVTGPLPAIEGEGTDY